MPKNAISMIPRPARNQSAAAVALKITKIPRAVRWTLRDIISPLPILWHPHRIGHFPACRWRHPQPLLRCDVERGLRPFIVDPGVTMLPFVEFQTGWTAQWHNDPGQRLELDRFRGQPGGDGRSKSRATDHDFHHR
jgi:hypothetical protein